jgi:hypothetical protein
MYSPFLLSDLNQSLNLFLLSMTGHVQAQAFVVSEIPFGVPNLIFVNHCCFNFVVYLFQNDGIADSIYKQLSK